MAQFGYHGKILHVDLAARAARVEQPDEKFWRIYGGGGLAIPSPMRERFTFDQLKEAYARQAVRVNARRNGWLLKEVGENEFVAERR